MACQIVIKSVNGVIPVGGTQPTRLRVTGTAYGCSGGVVMTTSPPNITAAMSSPATIDPNGRFLIDEQITPSGSVNCGDSVGVTVTCASDANCSEIWTAKPLACCTVSIVSVDGIAPQGSLVPSAIRVTGTLYGCASDQVTISMPTVGASKTVGVDPASGSFHVELPITGFACGTDIHVTAECVQGPTDCKTGWRKALPCSQCFRAEITVSGQGGPCTGSPAEATVTLTAQIGLPGNATGQFMWDFGDGTQSAPFAVTIPSGAPGASTTVTQTHKYQSGTYTAELHRIDVSECPIVQRTFTVTCDRCPQVTGSVVVGACEPPGPRAGTRPVTYTLTFNPPLAAGDTAYANISYGGPDINGTSTGSVSQTGPGALTHTAYLAHKPGGYFSTASVSIFDAANAALCVPPLPPISFSTKPTGTTPAVDVDPCLACPTAVQVAVGQPSSPLPSPHVQFTATVVWPAPAPPPPPPAPVFYDWTVTLPDNRQAKILNGPAVVTTQGPNWSGTGATGGAVDLSVGGNYSVSVTAKYATSAGLPTDPVTGVTSCNLTGGSSFPITGLPPTCPKITGVSVSSPDCADETQNKSATIGFSATVQNPGSVAGTYEWDFDDPGSPSNVIQTTAPTAQHVYAKPGTYTVTVSLASTPSCPATTAQATVTIGRCPCPEGQTRDSSGNCVPTDGNGNGNGEEGPGCTLLRWIAIFLIALGLMTFMVWLCVPGLPSWAFWVLLGIAIGLVIAGIVVLIVWALSCPVKPCLWGLLFAWQILLGVGLACLMLTGGPPGLPPCCSWMWVVGGVATGIGVILMAIWIYRCQPSFCQWIIELAPVVSTVLAVFGWISLVPIINLCVNGTVSAILATISGILVGILAACAASGTKTKTGAPVKPWP